jgi:hypothetical protein
VSIPVGIYKPMLAAMPAAVLIAVTLPIAACGSSSSLSSGVSGSSSPSSATSGASTAGLTNCFSHTVVQPKSLLLACGDGTVTASGLVWQGWGRATSTGRGTISYVDCNPSCVNGTERQAPGTVTVGRLQVCPDGRQSYTRLTYDYSGNQAGPVTMTVPCPPYQPLSSGTARSVAVIALVPLAAAASRVSPGATSRVRGFVRSAP